MKFLKTDSVHPVQSHGKLVADNDSGKKRGAIIHAKGPLISECLFDFLNFPKTQQKIWDLAKNLKSGQIIREMYSKH